MIVGISIIDGSRDLSASWTGFTQFTLFNEKLPEGRMWSGRRLTKRQATSRDEIGNKCEAEGEAEMGN